MTYAGRQASNSSTHERSEHVTVLTGCVAYVPPSTTDHARTRGRGAGGGEHVGA
jgi:hypothetical protein